MKNTRSKMLIWLIIIAVFTTHCQMYHLVDVQTNEFKDNPNKRSQLSYHLIIHLADNSVIELVNPKLKENNLEGIAIPVNEDILRIYQHSLSKLSFRGKVRQNKMHLNQLHLFVNKQLNKEGLIVISLNDLQKVQVLDKNRGLTTLSTIAIGVPSVIVSFIVYLMIACNCPHAYVQNGDNWEFTNTLYTGAVQPSLERHDYKTLQDFKTSSTSYALQIRNELDEIQYTDQLQLIAVYHAAGKTIVTDQNGHFFAVDQKVFPSKAIDDNGTSLAAQLKEADNEAYSFESNDQSNFAHVYATFHSEDWSEKSKLVIRAKNSDWGGYVYHQFTNLFGNKYDEWAASNSRKTKKQLDKNINKTGMLLDVEIKDGKQWKRIDQIQLIGEKAYQTFAVQIPEQFLNNQDLEIRLKSGFQFWDIDQLYMATTSQDQLEIVTYPAQTPQQKEVENLLLSDDAAYFIHDKGEAPLDVLFEGLRPEPRTLFMKSKGYYQAKQQFEGKPNYAALLEIRKNGGFSAFSKQQFEDLMLINAYFSEVPKE